MLVYRGVCSCNRDLNIFPSDLSVELLHGAGICSTYLSGAGPTVIALNCCNWLEKTHLNLRYLSHILRKKTHLNI